MATERQSLRTGHVSESPSDASTLASTIVQSARRSHRILAGSLWRSSLVRALPLSLRPKSLLHQGPWLGPLELRGHSRWFVSPRGGYTRSIVEFAGPSGARF